MSLPRRLPFLLALALMLVSGASLAALNPGQEYVPGELIVKFHDNVAAKAKSDLRLDVSGSKVTEFKYIGAEYWQIKSSVADAIRRLEADPRVEYAEPNYLVYALGTPNDTRFADLWGMKNNGDFTDASGNVAIAGADIDAVKAWDVVTGSHDVIVAVIDSGVDYTHPDLAGNIWTNPGEIAGNGIDDDGNGYIDDIHGYDFANNDGDPMDDTSHGTHCAGIIGGVGNNALGVAGVNWNVSIMALKFLTPAGYGTIANAIRCVEYATDMGVDVMSNSWGSNSNYDSALRAAIEAAYAADIFFVAAAGNDGNNNDAIPFYPSGYTSNNVISVMATDCTDSPVNEPGWWSTNYGATSVDIAAPGLHIWSTTPGNTYSDFSGTSMATPHVAGALALLRARFPNISVDDGKNRLMTVGNDVLPSLQGRCVTGARLNVLKLVATDPDTIPPSTVSDLTVVGGASTWMDLEWTAPGNDGITGTARSYDVRYAPTPISDEAAWDAATPATGEPAPAAYGTLETMRVEGLVAATTYYFSIRAKDDFGNTGGLSNSPAGTTLGAPRIAISPSALSTTLDPGGTDTQILTISNVGQDVLDFTIPDADYIPPATGYFSPAKAYDYPSPTKGESLGFRGFGPDKGTGGPDAFGYYWGDSNEAGGPAFNWIEIDTLGTLVVLGDDVTSGPFAIGFPFNFYGTDFNDFQVSSNGWISFTSSTLSWPGYGPLPGSSAPGNMLALFWCDLDPGSGGNVYYYNDGTRLIVEFKNVPYKYNSDVYTMQAQLYPNGTIEFHYLSMGTIHKYATIGIQNADKTDGLTVAYNNTYVEDNLAVRFAPVAPWLSTGTNSGSLAPGASVDVNVIFSDSGLCGSHFDANLHVLSNDPVTPDAVVACGLDLNGTPDITVAPAALDFGPVYVTAGGTLALAVRNNGCGDLNVAAVSVDHGDFGVSNAGPFTLGAGGTKSIDVTFAPSAAGTITGNVTITSDDADTPSLVVPLTGAGVNFPDIAIAPDSLQQTLSSGGTATQIITLTNNGQGDLNFTIPGAEYLDVAKRIKPQGKNAQPIKLAKGEDDPRVGAPVTLGAGGPDGFGYTWQDSDEPGGPSYNWIEINSVGTKVTLSDDDNVAGLPIGFTFPYYGNDFTTFNICSNGWISFSSTSTELTNYELPSTAAPTDLLALFHDDLDPSSGGWVGYYNDGTRLIVEYYQVPTLTSDALYTMQIQLNPNGRIEYHYNTMQPGSLDVGTIGIQNADGSDGLTVVFNAAYVHDAMAIRFDDQIPWLSATPNLGTVAPGESLDISVGFDAAGLCGDLFLANLHVLSNDPDTPDVAVPARMDLLAEPVAAIEPAALDFGQVQVMQSATLPVAITNPGCGTLEVSSLALDNGVFTADLAAPFTVSPGSQVGLNITFTPAAADTALGVLSLTTNDPLTPNFTVDLLGQGLGIGQITVSPDSLYHTVDLDNTATDIITITNNGSGDLDFSIPSPTMYNKMIAALGDLNPPAHVEKAKGAADDEFGLTPLGMGGPDAYGYSWLDSDEAGGPTFDWIEISTTGTLITSIGESSVVTDLPIGFTFPFYGNEFTTFNVCANGYLSFDSTSALYTNQPLPYASGPTNMIAPFWDDLNHLNLNSGGEIYYQLVDGNLVVQFNNVMPYIPTMSGTGPFTFEAILRSSGQFTLQYLDVSTALPSHTIGIQDGTRTIGLQVVYNAAYVHDGLAISFRGPVSWLSANPASGTIAPGASQDVLITMNALDMAPGPHDGLVQIASNDPTNPMVSVPVTMMVNGGASPVPGGDLPRTVVLDRNVPNPFNPMTEISFSLPKSDDVLLKVFDVRGALVRTLVNGQLEAGYHTCVWRGRNDRDQQVPSGVYIYRLETCGKVLTNRMTLLN